MSFKGLKNMAARTRTLLVAILVGNFFAVASAQELEIDGILGIVCTIQSWMSGPIAIAIGILILAIGGLMIAFGGKRSIPFVIWGVIGVAIALAAPSIFNTLTGGEESCGDLELGGSASITFELEESFASAELPFSLNG